VYFSKSDLKYAIVWLDDDQAYGKPNIPYHGLPFLHIEFCLNYKFKYVKPGVQSTKLKIQKAVSNNLAFMT
jgi:hypothetical protein